MVAPYPDNYHISSVGSLTIPNHLIGDLGRSGAVTVSNELAIESVRNL